MKNDQDKVAGHFAKFGQVENFDTWRTWRNAVVTSRKLLCQSLTQWTQWCPWYGQVTNVEIKKQPDGTSRGFAFVTFAEKAKQFLDVFGWRTWMNFVTSVKRLWICDELLLVQMLSRHLCQRFWRLTQVTCWGHQVTQQKNGMDNLSFLMFLEMFEQEGGPTGAATVNGSDTEDWQQVGGCEATGGRRTEGGSRSFWGQMFFKLLTCKQRVRQKGTNFLFHDFGFTLIGSVG